MTDNYTVIARKNMLKAWYKGRNNLAARLPAIESGDGLTLSAFGEIVVLSRNGIFKEENEVTGVVGLLISLYALWANEAVMVREPFKAFRETPNSAPYVAAFKANTETRLIPHVHSIKKRMEDVLTVLSGENTDAGGDFSFMVKPFPKICLHYVFYEADDEFPPSVTCLFSANASEFIPTDGLADVGEYTSKKIISIIS